MGKYKEIEYPRTQVKKAGRLFSSSNGTEEQREAALKVINNWRAAHAFPLQIIYMNLRKHAPEKALVAQRLKRLESITSKLSRFPTMSLSTMQDIGGCRVILDSIGEVYSFIDTIKRSQWKHRFKEEYDYIRNPKSDGYRCYHLVYAYYSDRNSKYNGLLIEIQVRTRYQHLWATAVETMDEIDGDRIKIGQGKNENREFFYLASQLLQVYEESGYNDQKVIETNAAERMRSFEKQNHVLNRLEAVRATEKSSEHFSSQSGYYLLVINSVENETKIVYYPTNQVEEATQDYDKREESKQPHEDVVLVSTSSIDALQRAYPNYFNNIKEFVGLMRRFIQE